MLGEAELRAALEHIGQVGTDACRVRGPRCIDTRATFQSEHLIRARKPLERVSWTGEGQADTEHLTRYR